MTFTEKYVKLLKSICWWASCLSLLLKYNAKCETGFNSHMLAPDTVLCTYTPDLGRSTFADLHSFYGLCYPLFIILPESSCRLVFPQCRCLNFTVDVSKIIWYRMWTVAAANYMMILCSVWCHLLPNNPNFLTTYPLCQPKLPAS